MKLSDEYDEVLNLHAEMMEKYDLFLGAHDAWESKAKEFKAFTGPRIRFLD